MCEFCSKESKWLVYVTKREDNLMACENHLTQAVEAIKDRYNANEIAKIERI